MIGVDEIGLRLGPLSAADIPGAHALSIKAGWPHRLEDWRFVLELGSGVGAIDVDGTLVGTAFWWPFGSGFATLGMVIVAQSHQRQGIGRRLMDAILAEAGDRSILLNSTRDGRRLYESIGFKPIGTIRQHQGVARPIALPELRPDERVRPIRHGDTDTMIALDEQATGMPRGWVLAALQRDSEAIVLLRREKLAGFAFIRRFGRGQVIGPVIAPDPDGAKLLIAHWIAAHAGSFVRIDTPPNAPGMSDWLAETGLAPISEVTTMVRGVSPVIAGDSRSYALVNQALG